MRASSSLLGLAVLGLTGTMGCRLLVETVIDDDVSVSGADAGPGADAMGADAALPISCDTWDYDPEEVDPCLIPSPGGALMLGPGQWQYDTNSGALTDPEANAQFPPSALVTFPGGVEVRVLSIAALEIGSGAVLRAEGQRPLVIVSWSSAEIDGEVDVSSSAVAAGAGSNPGACLVATPGALDADGAGGGGGGGLSSAGGPGGTGNLGVTSGGAGGLASPATSLRGGCNGEKGGNTLGGAGGIGGGAVAIVALESISISGLIHAGGGGGIGSAGERSGGGGGGSGGVIQLEAPSLSLDESAVVAANGGGGGGGSDNNDAGDGGDGAASDTPASAGSKEGKGANGGAGSDSSGGEGEAGDNAERGGGGGGGGAGQIFLRSTGLSGDDISTISPTP